MYKLGNRHSAMSRFQYCQKSPVSARFQIRYWNRCSPTFNPYDSVTSGINSPLEYLQVNMWSPLLLIIWSLLTVKILISFRYTDLNSGLILLTIVSRQNTSELNVAWHNHKNMDMMLLDKYYYVNCTFVKAITILLLYLTWLTLIGSVGLLRSVTQKLMLTSGLILYNFSNGGCKLINSYTVIP